MPKRPIKNDPRSRPLKPLKRFDYALVADKLTGLLINVDRDLGRRISVAVAAQDTSAERCLFLSQVFIRFARNSYNAVRYIVADTPPDPMREASFALIIPTVNRQLLDLLFSLVYMLDNFEERSWNYQRAAYRELREEQHQFKTAFSGEEEWQQHFENLEGVLKNLAEGMKVTNEEQANPKLIPYWKHPFELKDEQTASRPFLRYLDKWLYGDTSAQAHLSFAGLFRIAPMLISDGAGAEAKQLVENRLLPQYRFQNFSRLAVVCLAIATEIDTYYKLENVPTIDYLWVMFSEYVAEAKEMYAQRYQNRSR